MEQEVIRHRNAVFNLIYYSTLAVYKNWVPVTVRWVMEIGVLCMALVTLFLWGYVHFTYIVNSEDCLIGMTERPFSNDVILQVEVYSNTSEVWQERENALQELYDHTHNKRRVAGRKFKENRGLLSMDWIKNFCETSFVVNLTGTNFLCQLILAELFNVYDSAEGDANDVENATAHVLEDNVSVCVADSNSTCRHRDFYDSVLRNSEEGPFKMHFHNDRLLTEAEFYSKNYTLYDLMEFYSLHMLVLDYSILEFSQEPGYLSLTRSARSKLNISVVKLYLDPESTSCFGGPFGRMLTKYFLGYDMMVISSFKGLLSSNHGYVKNLLTDSQYFYKVQWMGKWRYGAGILPALFFTLVASVLLRRIHYHIFNFLTHFHHLLNQGIPMPIHTGAQIPFLIVTYATIGLVIVMSEALSDDSIFSFLMVGTVWEVDQFYSVYCKQATSKIYLPWFFFLYHFLPYAYYIRFNGQFWFIPFLFHWLLLQHAMLFFLHHCELPSLAIHVVHQPPVNLQLHMQPDLPLQNHDGLNEGEEASGDDQGESASEHEDNADNEEQLVGSASPESDISPGSSLNKDIQDHVTPSGPKENLMRSQLHRTSSDVSSTTNPTSISVASSQASSYQAEHILSDEELRLVRLQRFERKVE